jgi:hypothetical protein
VLDDPGLDYALPLAILQPLFRSSTVKCFVINLQQANSSSLKTKLITPSKDGEKYGLIKEL